MFRRFHAMQRLLVAGKYFSDEEMKERSPWLYGEYISRYFTEREV
jgi:Coiled-coil domain containing protein (DUF2052)